MRRLLAICLSLFLAAAPAVTFADSHGDGNVVDEATTVVKENPGKAAGVAGCVAILIFPPAAAWCAATIVGGATYDGDTQEIVKKTGEMLKGDGQ